MFFRAVEHKGQKKTYRHLQIVESFRDPAKGNSPRTRILYNFGPIEEMGEAQLAKLGISFLKATGQSSLAPDLLNAKDYGHVFAAQAVWDKLAFSKALRRAGISGKSKDDFCGMVRWLVLNRLCEPCSKLDWLESIPAPRDMPLSYHKLLRSMDRLINIKENAEPLLAEAVIAPDEPVDMVFYDITSTYFEGDRSVENEDIRRFGYSRDHRKDRRQVVIGMVVTKGGIPLCHHVFPGNTPDKVTVIQVISDLKKRFALHRVIFVGDRGMLSDDNLSHIIAENLDFIVAFPLRGNSLSETVIKSVKKQINKETQDEQFFEIFHRTARFVLAFSPKIAAESRMLRHKRLEKADTWLKPVLEKLSKPSGRGRKATPQGTYDRIRDYLRDRTILKLYHLELCGDRLTIRKNRKALNWEDRIDGMLLLETTNMTTPASEIIKYYKGLAEIERGWRCLKSNLELRPVYHWTERRIRAHIFLCVISLQLERWMRNKLKNISVSKAMQSLRQIKLGELQLGDKTLLMPTRLTWEQRDILNKLEIAEPPRQIKPSIGL
jgi:transposase